MTPQRYRGVSHPCNVASSYRFDMNPRHAKAILRRCKTYSQCVSLAPPRVPLKLSLLHSTVFHMLLNSFFFEKCNKKKRFSGGYALSKECSKNLQRELDEQVFNFYRLPHDPAHTKDAQWSPMIPHTPNCGKRASGIFFPEPFSRSKTTHPTWK